MDYRARTLRAGTGLAIVPLMAASLASCSGANTALPTTPMSTLSNARTGGPPAPGSTQWSAQPNARHKKAKQWLFVSDNENNRVLVYDASAKTQNPPVTRTITTGVQAPNGLATDLKGNLYVTNYTANTVTIYPPNAGKPKTTISNGLNGPFDVKVDGFGNVYVANDPLYGPTGFIELYPSGSTSPAYTWSAPSSGETISGIALLNPMQKGETSIYALAYAFDSSGFAIGGALSCYPGDPTCASFGSSFGQTGGIAVAQSPGGSSPFQWLAVDQYVPGVDIFTQGESNSQIVTGGLPEFITLNSTGDKLYVADRFRQHVVEYSYPSGKQMNTFTPPNGPAVYGVATSPAGTFH